MLIDAFVRRGPAAVRLLFVLLCLALPGCHARSADTASLQPLDTASSIAPPPMAITLSPQVNATDWLRLTRVLTSPAFGGRKPGTRAEVLSTHYLVAQLKRMGIEPGYRGTWLQPVPIVSIRLRSTDTRLQVQLPGGMQRFAYGSDLLATTQQARAHVNIVSAPIVFVGYGIDAPARQWNDYQGLDARGKIVIALAGGPGEAGGTLGRHALAREKFALAARMGAAGCLIIHGHTAWSDTWSALRNREAGAEQYLPVGAAPGPRLAVAGWLRHAAAERLFSAAGLDLSALTAAAAQPAFKAVALGATASIRLDSAVEYGWTDNVLGLIRGAVHPRQVVIYSAHWDGLGTVRAPNGRRERLPGAIDDAGGLAALLEIADAFAHRRHPPARSVLFLMPTLGDAGQLGARYYIRHPVFGLARTVADIDIDLWPILGRARDMTLFGGARSGIADDLQRVLALQGRTLSTAPASAIALAYRSSQYRFARAAVPAILAGPGLDLLSGGRVAGETAWREALLNRLATPGDAFNPHWDLSGTLEDIQTLYVLGRRLADGAQWPKWAAGSPYRARRDAMTRRAGIGSMPPAAAGPSPP